MHIGRSSTIGAVIFLLASAVTVAAQHRSTAESASAVPTSILLQIVRVEDERRWDDTLKRFLSDKNPQVRKRAALAAGRIGNEGAVPILAEMLLTDRHADARQMAAFALGEIELPRGAYALLQIVRTGSGSDRVDTVVRARAVEALGKIAGAMLAVAPADANAAN